MTSSTSMVPPGQTKYIPFKRRLFRWILSNLLGVRETWRGWGNTLSILLKKKRMLYVSKIRLLIGVYLHKDVGL